MHKRTVKELLAEVAAMRSSDADAVARLMGNYTFGVFEEIEDLKESGQQFPIAVERLLEFYRVRLSMAIEERGAGPGQ